MRTALLAVLLLSTAGCGVLTGGTTKTIGVVSVPAGAQIRTTPPTGTFTTPTALVLQRKSAYTITATREGYTPAEFQIQQRMRTGPLILDILFTGLIGVIIDAATGGWYDLQPGEVTMAMEQIEAANPGADQITLQITHGEDGAMVITASEPVQIDVVGR